MQKDTETDPLPDLEPPEENITDVYYGVDEVDEMAETYPSEAEVPAITETGSGSR